MYLGHLDTGGLVAPLCAPQLPCFPMSYPFHVRLDISYMLLPALDISSPAASPHHLLSTPPKWPSPIMKPQLSRGRKMRPPSPFALLLLPIAPNPAVLNSTHLLTLCPLFLGIASALPSSPYTRSYVFRCIGSYFTQEKKVVLDTTIPELTGVIPMPLSPTRLP